MLPVMNHSYEDEVPVVLQLRRWSSQPQLNLSDSREAFISPTREILLLLSYQREATLIPLVTGFSVTSIEHATCCHGGLQDPSSEVFCSLEPETMAHDGLDSIGTSSYSANRVYDDLDCGCRSSAPKDYAFIHDVDSLAWGLRGDDYNQHNEQTFREFLFVCGDQGVTVHAFCRSQEGCAMNKTQENKLQHGDWAEWGPSMSDCSETRTGTHVSKRWLRTFLTSVETVEFEGNFCTKFPEKTSFPCSAKVVSFRIFDIISPVDVLFCGSSSNAKQNCMETVLNPVDDTIINADTSQSIKSGTDVQCNFLNLGKQCLYKCSSVFSNNSHQLIGFILLVDTGIERDIVLAVSRLDDLGMHWACSVKLENTVDKGLKVEWTDFQFSDSLVACLTASGLIFLYSVKTGEYVARLDILPLCGLNTYLREQENISVEGAIVLTNTDTLIGDGDYKLNHEARYLSSKRRFRKLIVASCTSFLAAVDEHGVVYILSAGDCIPDKFYSYEKLLPHFKHLGLGILAGWKVGGCEISHQRVFSTTRGEFSSTIDYESIENRVIPERNLNGKGIQYDSEIRSQKFQSSKAPFLHMRRIFLPPYGSSEDDTICFSPFGITRLFKKHDFKFKRSLHIVHSNLHVGLTVHDDTSVGKVNNLLGMEETLVGEAAGCVFQGCFYLVTEVGLSVVLPSIALSTDFLPVKYIRFRKQSINDGIGHLDGSIFTSKETTWSQSPLKTEIMDRLLVYEASEEADRICLVNGWDLKNFRTRRLQLALEFLNFQEIQKSLEMLVSINLSEEGILRLLFVAVYLIIHKAGSDGDVSAALRLLTLATQFAIKMIRKYGLAQHRKCTIEIKDARVAQITCSQSFLIGREKNVTGDSRSLVEVAHLLEIIRHVQYRLSVKFRRAGQGLENGGEVSSGVESNLLEDDSQFFVHPTDSVLLELEGSNQQEIILPPALGVSQTLNLALMPIEPLEPEVHLSPESEISAVLAEGKLIRKKAFTVENPKDMIVRWKIDKLDFKTVVKDALLSGRLPLAVLQLHLHRLNDLISDKEEPYDTFTEVHDVGRAIAYDLFLKGETGLAVAILQRLGEDVETSLKQLVFGTVRKTLRVQITEELKRYGYLGLYESKILEKISLIERFYPCSSFWRTFFDQKEVMKDSSRLNLPREHNLRLLHSHFFINHTIECGEIDGVVLGSWENVKGDDSINSVIEEDIINGGYWAAAAVWSDVWDQRTIDRILLDQPVQTDANLLWESQFEYYLCHNDWEELSILLHMIPLYLLSNGSLQVCLDGLQSPSNVKCNMISPAYEKYIPPPEELDVVSMDVQDVNIFGIITNNMCSTWLRTLLEQELAKKFIFLREYWTSTADIIPLLSRSGFITGNDKIFDQGRWSLSDLGSSGIHGTTHVDPVLDFHGLVIHHCVLYHLPNFLSLYLDYHNLASDNDLLGLLQRAAGDCQWAKWLLLARIKGREYDTSFSNTYSIMSHNLVPGNTVSILEIDEVIRTVDDIAEGGGEIAALATLMFAPLPIQDCLSTGSVNRHHSSSAQCTLENLSPTFQRFPTLWHTLVSVCLGQDVFCKFLSPVTKNVFGNSPLSEYLNWRANLFSSTGRDTSLCLMLPCWFPRAIRRLIHLYVQGPLEWQSLAHSSTPEAMMHKDLHFFLNADEHIEVTAISWETAIQKHIEEELYTSSLKETGLRLEPHLHRGRAMTAFNYILSVRLENLKLGISQGKTVTSGHGSANVQSDVQKLLAPITESEECLLSSVKPLAIMHFEDSVLVASCAFLLELCGLSASMIRVDITALKRISSFHKSNEYAEHYRQLSPKGSAFHTVLHEGDITYSLARALADDYLHRDGASCTKQNGTINSFTSNEPSRALMLVLQHLEMASLPFLSDRKTCGSWLLNGNGDGTELRFLQKTASQYWDLVTVFCQMHQLPFSTKYLAVLAKDNDWVGFLSEAQAGGYSLDTVIQVASKEFSDPRLKIHILTVLRGMHLRKKPNSASNSDVTEAKSETSFLDENMYIPVELFGILAECEKQKNPGESLLIKAKELYWSVLAMLASCFPDVSPLSCLIIWLEITAAREISSIKIDDIASQITINVGAAVDSTNSMTVGSKALTFHYNRRNPKRRRLMEPMSVEPLKATASDASSSVSESSIFFGIIDETVIKPESSECNQVSEDSVEESNSLSKMVSVLCEKHLFLPLLRAFDMFLPSCSLLPFIRALQAFSQMRLSEASAHLESFSARITEESSQISMGKEHQIGTSWMIFTVMKAVDSVLSMCPSPYEKRCLLELLASTDFGDGGSAATYYQRLFWKINLAEPLLRKDDSLHLGSETLDDGSLLTALEQNGHWEHARNWARQMEASGAPWKYAVHHVTEVQAESMVAEWKEFLWDVAEERVTLWGNCQMLFLRYSFPPLQAGLFFLKHAEAVEKDIPARELHELLLLSLQWLSGMITLSNPAYPLHLLREIETRVWLLAVESEAHTKSEGDSILASSVRDPVSGNCSNIIDRTASIIAKMDSHINTMKNRVFEQNDARVNIQTRFKIPPFLDSRVSGLTGGGTKIKRRAKSYVPSRQIIMDKTEKMIDPKDNSNSSQSRNDLLSQDENFRVETSSTGWEERVGPTELKRAVLSLLEFGQITASKQLQHKLSPAQIPSEFMVINAALKFANLATPNSKVSISVLDEELCSVIQSYIPINQFSVEPLQVLGSLATTLTEGRGRGLCKRIMAIVGAANVLGLSFSEAFDKPPNEVLQLLSLKAQDSFEEANLLVQTHFMAAASIAQILAETFLKGLLAAHRGGYMDSQKEEGPAPLLWRFSDFLKWAELCPSEPEIGHSLMRLVITGQEIPHTCEVELLILSHHFYKSSACLDGVDVLVSLAATRVEAYVSEGDFACLARLITGVGNFHALNFILGILIENGQLDLLLQKFSAAAATNTGTAEAVRGFRMAVLTSLKLYNPNDLDAFAMVYNHFDMKHETASLLESRAEQSSQRWFLCYDKDHNEDLLESMRYYIEAAEVHSSIDAGNKTQAACAHASLVSLQIRIPDFKWLCLSETNARRALVEQSRFQEALIVAEAYGLNWPSEWALVLWNQMLKPELTEQFVAEFVAVLPLHPSMLVDLSKFYRAEVAARGDQSQFSVWLTGGGLPAEWAKYLGRSFRCLLKCTRDLTLRLQLATVATGFNDVIQACAKSLDKVPEMAGPLVLRKGHGGAYLPLM